MRLVPGLSIGSVLLLACGTFSVEPDLSEYRTVDKAIAAKTGKAAIVLSSKPPYLGLHLTLGPQGRLTVDEIAIDSPAAKAGIMPGDVIESFDGKTPKDDDDVLDIVKSKSTGSPLKLQVMRNKKSLSLTATLGTPSNPMVPSKARMVFGVQIAPVKEGGVVIEQVVAGSPAERAKLKVGEVILKIDDVDVGTVDKFNDAVATKQPEDSVTVTLLLAEKKVEMKMSLRPEGRGNRRGGGGPGGGGGWDLRAAGRYWSKPTYRIAIINVEYPDQKHDAKIAPKAWEEAMFSTTGYKTTATGQNAYGSMYDYYWEQSYGQLKVEGKSFDYVEVSKKRGEYEGNQKNIFFSEAMDKLLAREGKDALKGYDGVFFIYAGDRFPNAPRGGLYWPHRASFNYKGARWDYFICSERAEQEHEQYQRLLPRIRPSARPARSLCPPRKPGQ